MKKWLVSSAIVASTLALSAGAMAQDKGGDDHEKVVGSFGISWFGVSDIPVAARIDVTQPGPNGTPPARFTRVDATVSAPAVGVRYWVDDMLGIDVGLGINIASRSEKLEVGNATTEPDLPSSTAFLLHGGVPLALAHKGHFVFLVTPELNLGLAKVSQENANRTDEFKGSGFLLQAGARAGTELHFGFIGVPKLSLEASVGLYFQTSSTKGELGNVTSSGSETLISTSSINQPWDIFRSVVAARYYF